MSSIIDRNKSLCFNLKEMAGKGLESDGFKQCPGFDFYVHPNRDDVVFPFVDSTGKLSLKYKVVSRSNITVKEGVVAPGYFTVNHYGKTLSIHVLKAMTFLPLTGPAEKLQPGFTYDDIAKENIVVNHIDGNKTNCDISNLEWMTYSENLVHAFKSGLRTDNYFGVAYDVIKEKEFEFYSINEFGRQIGLHGDYISRYLKSPRTSLLAHRYMVRHKHESDYPVKLTKDDVWRKSIGGCLPMLVRDTETDKWHIFGTISHLTHELGFKTKKSIFGSEPKVRTIGKFEFHPIHDYETVMNAKRISERFIACNIDAVRGIRKPIPVGVRLPDGTEKRFSGTQEAAEYFGLTKATLKARLSKFNGRWKNLQFWFIKD